MQYKNGELSTSFIEKTIHKYQRSKLCNNFITAKIRQAKLNNKNFTIISNNCWGGVCYEYFGLRKASPTIGMYIFSHDYIKFLKDLKKYLRKKIIFIDYKESKYKDILEKRGHTNVPIGLLEDVEIIFLHYPNNEIAKKKWYRRVKRVNYDNLIIKYSNQNQSSYKDILEFSKLKYKNKVFFLSKFINDFPDAIYYPEFKDAPELMNDTYIWNKYIDIFSIINGLSKK
ncbi:MAG: DUF1919 domain-containing protein [Halanaerobiales bacterium]|nr:DUF1919 domain-containing protein [Halanaerobiales bacterium]